MKSNGLKTRQLNRIDYLNVYIRKIPFQRSPHPFQTILKIRLKNL